MEAEDYSAPLNDQNSDDIEVLLHSCEECFVYKLPPRPKASGYAAASWGLDSPVATTSLRVTSKGNCVIISLWRSAPDSSTSKRIMDPSDPLFSTLTFAPLRQGQLLVALTQFDITNNEQTLDYWLEPTVDSSRYFVLRCTGIGVTNSASSLLGIGFRERMPAFSLRATIMDHFAQCRRQEQLKNRSEDTGSSFSFVIPGGHEDDASHDADVSLNQKEGVRGSSMFSLSGPVTLSFKGLNISCPSGNTNEVTSSSATGAAVPTLLPPPPAFTPSKPFATATTVSNTDATETNSEDASSDSEDEFGDFAQAV